MKPFAMLLASAAILVAAPSALPAQNPGQVDTVDPTFRRSCRGPRSRTIIR